MEDKKHTQIYVDMGLHRELKIASVLQAKTVIDVIRDAFIDYKIKYRIEDRIKDFKNV